MAPDATSAPLAAASTPSDEPALSLIEQLRSYAKFKDRSSTTHDQDHAPLLARNEPIECLLLGHSFIERFKSTGQHTQFGPQYAPYPNFFNAGVGGDKISNVIFRLIEKGLLTALRESGVRYTLLVMGTNDLVDDRRPLEKKHIDMYRLIIEALWWACPDVKICVCAIAPKRRVKKEGIVEDSNILLEAMVEETTRENPEFVVEFMPTQPELIDCLEPDGVHLNGKGYDIFGEALWDRYQAMRARYEQV